MHMSALPVALTKNSDECAGWCVWFFTLLAGGVLLIVNTKLVWIARYVTRGGIVHRLKPGWKLS